jgi:tRNA A-37 threonylcarbamoyl transferase component Bud32/tetratricopeptide (TPR) repeat protein
MATQPRIIAGRYEIERPLGKGGMGAVYLARDLKLFERHVAVKLLREDLDDEQVRLRFVREAQSAASLRHQNIVTILDFGDHEGQPYLVIEFIEGETMYQIIKRKAALPLSRKLQLMEELCSGLGHAHKEHVVHRDIKPPNLMITSADQQLKILDFGIARLGESSMTQTGGLLGSVNYMSPEQVGSGGRVDYRSDIFAVGVIFYELLSYKQAFPGTPQNGVFSRICHDPPKPLQGFCPDLDSRIIRIVDKAMEKDAAERYSDLGTMRRDIARVRALEQGIRGDQDVEDSSAATTVLLGSTEAVDDIGATVESARRAFDQGEFSAAIVACERVLEAEPTRATAAALLERARAAQTDTQIEQWLGEARREVERGAFTGANALVDRAEMVSPNSPRVRATRASIDKARATQAVAKARQRFENGDYDAALNVLADHSPPNTLVSAAYEELRGKVDRNRQIADLMSRASACLEDGRFGKGLELVAEVQELVPDDSAALQLRRDLDTRLAERVERLVREAREQFAGGDLDGAIDRLAAHDPPDPVVTAACEELRTEAERLRRVADLVSQASGSLLNSEFGTARSLVSQALAIESTDPSALDLQRQLDSAHLAYAEKRVKTARRRVDQGKPDAALELLADTPEPHPMIAQALAELRTRHEERTVVLPKGRPRQLRRPDLPRRLHQPRQLRRSREPRRSSPGGERSPTGASESSAPWRLPWRSAGSSRVDPSQPKRRRLNLRPKSWLLLLRHRPRSIWLTSS